MKQTNILLTSFLLLTLAGGVSNAQGVSKWKYVPQALKKTKIPSVLNPKLPLQTRVKWGALNPVLDKTVVRAAANEQAPALKVTPVATVAPIPASCPDRFVDFVHWLDELSPSCLAVQNKNTQQALAAIRNAVINYNALPQQEKPFLNGLMITLNQMRPYLKLLPNGDVQRLIYTDHTPSGKLPQAHHFQVQIRQGTLTDPFFNPYEKNKHIWAQSFRFARHKDNPQQLIRGIIFFQGFMPQTAREEMVKALQAIIPQGAHIHMGTQELGLNGENRTKFREGKLHLHIESSQLENVPFPMQKNIELMLSPKPYAGIIDVRTRQILIPNNDQTIARNYLILFEPFLDEEGKSALQDIINGN